MSISGGFSSETSKSISEPNGINHRSHKDKFDNKWPHGWSQDKKYKIKTSERVEEVPHDLHQEYGCLLEIMSPWH